LHRFWFIMGFSKWRWLRQTLPNTVSDMSISEFVASSATNKAKQVLEGKKIFFVFVKH